MKVATLIVALFVGSASAAPAIVWTNDNAEAVVHSSKTVKASSLLSHGSESDSSLATAVFLVGRSSDGSETLSGLTSSGSLPLVASKYNDATAVHSHVAGIESPFSIVRDVGADTDRRVLQVSLNEFSSKLTSIEKDTPETDIVVDEQGMVNRAKAELVVVNVPSTVAPSLLDELVMKAIDNKSVGTVILAGVRSADEVKLERSMAQRRKMKTLEDNGKRRRLEDANNGDDDNANNNNNDGTTGVYFVHMTPNIFAGILFTLMFTVVTFIGVSCMGMIAGQDVYVTKMPTIGREA